MMPNTLTPPSGATLAYRVATFREAGLEAKWGKARLTGAPLMFVRDPAAKLAHQREKWWLVDRRMFADMQRDGIRVAFLNWTLIADVFSLPS